MNSRPNTRSRARARSSPISRRSKPWASSRFWATIWTRGTSPGTIPLALPATWCNLQLRPGARNATPAPPGSLDSWTLSFLTFPPPPHSLEYPDTNHCKDDMTSREVGMTGVGILRIKTWTIVGLLSVFTLLGTAAAQRNEAEEPTAVLNFL